MRLISSATTFDVSDSTIITSTVIGIIILYIIVTVPMGRGGYN